MSARPNYRSNDSDPPWVDESTAAPPPRTVRPQSYLPTPAFVLVRDGDGSEFGDGSFDDVPHLKVMSPSVVRTVSKYWFNPPWINDDFVPCVNHGEFDSPVWLATSLAIRADRELDECFAHDANRLNIPGTVHGDRGGQLRSLLRCIETATKAAATHRAPAHVPERRVAANRPWAGGRNHRLPTPAPASSQVSKLVRFISINKRKVSVNTD
jgi:hypothetical protein